MKKVKLFKSLISLLSIGIITIPIDFIISSCKTKEDIAPNYFYFNSKQDNTYTNYQWNNSYNYIVNSNQDMRQLFTNNTYPNNMIKWDIIGMLCSNYDQDKSWSATFSIFERKGINLMYEVNIKDENNNKHQLYTTSTDFPNEQLLQFQPVNEFIPNVYPNHSIWRIHLNDSIDGTIPIYWGGLAQFIHLKNS